MANFEFRNEKPLTVDEVLRVRDKFKAKSQHFVDFRANSEQFGESRFKRKLPAIDQFPGVEFTSIDLVAFLPVSDKSFKTLQAVLSEHGGTPLGCEGILSISVGYEEANSQQKKSTCDTMVAEIRYGHAFFGYCAGAASKVANDNQYAATFFAELAKTADLPLTVVQQHDDYFLDHRDQKELRTSFKGTRGENPKSFHCELAPEVTAESLCQRLDRALHSHASEKRFNYSWAFSVEDKDGGAVARLYAAIVEARLPASRYEAAYSLRLSDLRGIGVLKDLCEGKGEVMTQICRFDFGTEDDYGELYAVTSSDGHRLELRLEDDDHLPAMEQLAGFKFFAV